jgi:hypothetical protein
MTVKNKSGATRKSWLRRGGRASDSHQQRRGGAQPGVKVETGTNQPSWGWGRAPMVALETGAGKDEQIRWEEASG